jgi:hypothetical protein
VVRAATNFGSVKVSSVQYTANGGLPICGFLRMQMCSVVLKVALKSLTLPLNAISSRFEAS